MTDKEFKKCIKDGLSGGYLIYGDEEYLINHYVKLACDAVMGDNGDFADFNLIKIEEDNYSPEALGDAVSTFPMMNDKVCVVCRIRLSSLSDKELEELLEVLETLDRYPAVLLVLAPRDFFDAGNIKKNKPSAMYKKLTKFLQPVEMPHQTPALLKKWIMRHFEPEGISSDDRSLGRICEMCDYDMTALSRECEKLICYMKANSLNEVTPEIISNVCCEYGEAGAFALTNAIVTGDKTEALGVLKEYKDKRRAAVSVLGAIISDFSNMLTVSVYMKSGLYKVDIAKKTGLHEFRVGRYMEAVKGKDPERVRKMLELCRDADMSLKSSSVDYIALERLICTMPGRKTVRKY